MCSRSRKQSQRKVCGKKSMKSWRKRPEKQHASSHCKPPVEITQWFVWHAMTCLGSSGSDWSRGIIGIGMMSVFQWRIRSQTQSTAHKHRTFEWPIAYWAYCYLLHSEEKGKQSLKLLHFHVPEKNHHDVTTCELRTSPSPHAMPLASRLKQRWRWQKRNLPKPSRWSRRSMELRFGHRQGTFLKLHRLTV